MPATHLRHNARDHVPVPRALQRGRAKAESALAARTRHTTRKRRSGTDPDTNGESTK